MRGYGEFEGKWARESESSQTAELATETTHSISLATAQHCALSTLFKKLIDHQKWSEKGFGFIDRADGTR